PPFFPPQPTLLTPRKRIPMLRKVMHVAAIVAALLRPSVSLAQAPGGAITGVVRDSSGGAIPGSTVRVVKGGSGVATEAAGGEGGAYRVDGLAAGRYRVEASLDGFDTAIAQVALQ